MAFIDDIRGFEASLLQQLRTSLEQARLRARKRRKFNRTCDELDKLTDRQLSDLGIARCDIARVARAASDGD